MLLPDVAAHVCKLLYFATTRSLRALQLAARLDVTIRPCCRYESDKCWHVRTHSLSGSQPVRARFPPESLIGGSAALACPSLHARCRGGG